MGRLANTLRIVCLIALPFAIVGGHVAAKAYHQMHTPLPFYVVQGGH
jgi:hypothetical protein